MIDRLVVVVAVAAHLAFLGYLVVGGLIALRYPRTIWLHVVTVIWAVVMLAGRVECPLTWVERWARNAGGMAPLPDSGFIDHYLTGVIYPADALDVVQILVFAVVIGSWIALGVRWQRHRTAGATHRPQV